MNFQNFEFKPRISPVAKHGAQELTPVVDVFDVFGDDKPVDTLDVHDVAILIRDLTQALAEATGTKLEYEKRRREVEELQLKVASRSVE